MLRRLALGLIVVIAVLVSAGTEGHAQAEAERWLTGQVLVARPEMRDPRFAGTVIYIISHDAGGAKGLVVNRAFGRGRLAVLMESFGFAENLVDRAGDDEIRLQYGGPVEPRRGFVLHSADYAGESTRNVAGNIAVSVGLDVYEAMVGGRGPQQRRFILGYAGWGPGQLEGELAREDWLTAPGDEVLIFADDLDRIWSQAIAAAGVTL